VLMDVPTRLRLSAQSIKSSAIVGDVKVVVFVCFCCCCCCCLSCNESVVACVVVSCGRFGVSVVSVLLFYY